VTVKPKVACTPTCTPYNIEYKGTSSFPFDYLEIAEQTYKMLYKHK
jgi:hypothetical protein